MIKKIIRKCKNKFKKMELQKTKSVIIHKNVQMNNNTLFEGKNAIYDNTVINDSYLGLGTYISNDSHISNCFIGRFCSIGPRVKVIRGTHPLSPYVSTHPSFFSTYKQAGFTFVNKPKFEEFKQTKNKKKSVEIGNDVWIGSDVIILEGINIGDGAIVGSGAIVTKDIEAYTINVGCPAKKIRNRFKKEEIAKLEEIKWWEKDWKWISKNKELFLDIDDFIKKIDIN